MKKSTSRLEAPPPGLAGLEQLQALIAAGGRPPIGESLSFALAEVAGGCAAFEGEPRAFAYNPLGTVHGGDAATLLGSACGCAAHTKPAPGQGDATLQLKVAYDRPMTAATGRVRIERRMISFGRRVGFAEAKLLGPDGRLRASASSSLLVFEL